MLSGASVLPSAIHINAGGGIYVDSLGREFAPDPGFTGGSAVQAPQYDVQNTIDPELYLSFRSGSAFQFSADVADGDYVLLLEFAESQYTAPAQRTFDVFAQGQQILDNFDIVAAAGGAGTAVAEARTVHVAGGSLQLQFKGETGDAIVSAISLIPTDVPTDAAPYSWQNLTEPERMSISQRNLRWIGNALLLYSNDHRGRYPNAFGSLIEGFDNPSLATWIAASPRTNTQPPRGAMSSEQAAAWFDQQQDYIYLGAGKNSSTPANVVVVYENPDRVSGSINVLLGDGHVELWDRANAAAQIGFPLADPSDPPVWPAPMPKDPLMATSQSHLASIFSGLVHYSNDNKGRFPTSLGILFQSYGVAVENFVDPRTGTQPPPSNWTVAQKAAWINSSSDYLFPAAGLRPWDSAVAVCENPLSVSSGINVVTVNGIVEYREMRWGLESIAQQTAPTVLDSKFDFERAPQSIQFSLSEGVFSSLDAADLVLTNVTTGAVIPSAQFSVRYDWHLFTVHFDYDTANFGALPDGNYRAVLLSSGVFDGLGKHPAADYLFNFFVLGGDANRDRKVDMSDLGILAFNWGRTGMQFSDGDFNLDGVVGPADLGILATHWQTSLPSIFPPRRAPTRQSAVITSLLRDGALL